jgi:hypothetical protein
MYARAPLSASLTMADAPVLVAVALVIAVLVFTLRHQHVSPSGLARPRTWPAIGSYLSLGRDPPAQLLEWSAWYGPVYALRLGSSELVVVNSAAAAESIFNVNGIASASRPVMQTFNTVLGALPRRSARRRGASQHAESALQPHQSLESAESQTMYR